jgi:hypothetical protein
MRVQSITVPCPDFWPSTAAPLIAQEYAGRSAKPLSGPWISDRGLCRFSFLTLRAHIATAMPAGYIGIDRPCCTGSSMRLRHIALTTATVRLVVPNFRIAFLR